MHIVSLENCDKKTGGYYMGKIKLGLFAVCFWHWWNTDDRI